MSKEEPKVGACLQKLEYDAQKRLPSAAVTINMLTARLWTRERVSRAESGLQHT
jgi:hypothetical protein